jgi:hypothetical protein
MRNNGFAIALDALMAIILVTALLVFLSQQPELPSPGLDTSQRLKEVTSNAFASLENSGILGDLLVEQIFNSGTGEEVFLEAQKLVPVNVDLRVKITAFNPTEDMDYCRNQRRFEACFQNAGVSNGGSGLPTGKEIVYGKKLVVIRQPGSENTTNGVTLCVPEEENFSPQTNPFSYASFQDANIPVIDFRALAYSNSMACASGSAADGSVIPASNSDPPDNNPPGHAAEYSTVTLKARNQTRNPLSVYMILDKSGSMSTYDMNLQSVSGSFGEGTCNNTACHSTDSGIQTNCGTQGGITASACGDYLANPAVTTYYTNYGKTTTWTLSDANYSLFQALPGNAKLLFIQNPSYNYYGACASCDSKQQSTKRTPFITVSATNPSATAYREWANQLYFNKTDLLAGQQFTVSGWNSYNPIDPYSRPKWAWMAIADPVQGILPENNFVIPKSEDVQFCDYAPPIVEECLDGVCGQYHRFRTVHVPDDFAVLTGRPDQNILIQAYVYLGPFATTSICPPSIKVLFTRPDGFQQFLDPLVWACSPSAPYDFCYAYFPNTGRLYWSDYGARLPMGTYEFYIASDQEIEVDYSAIFYNVFLGYLFPPTQSYDSGECSGNDCFYTTSQPQNCPNPSQGNDLGRFFSSGNAQQVMTDEKTLDSFSVPEGMFLRGIQASETITNYNGGCPFAATGFIDPLNDSNHVLLNFLISASTVHSHSINNPPNVPYHRLDVHTIIPPIPSGTYAVKGWAAQASTQYTVTWQEQRIDAAQAAASNFINNDNWKEKDEIGLVVFSDNAQELFPLSGVDAETRADLENQMKTIATGGETNIYDAIHIAHDRLNSTAQNQRRFIVLLSDGLANLPTNPSDPDYALHQAVGEAQTAYGIDGIITYTIAFGRDAIDWNPELNQGLGGWQCKEPLTEIATAGGGKCYPANDQQQLAEIYELIAGQIQQDLGQTDLEMPLYPGQLINAPQCNPGNPEIECGLSQESESECPLSRGIYLRKYTSHFPDELTDTCWSTISSGQPWHLVGNDESLVFKDILINQVNTWWDANFNVAWPCDGEHCVQELVFPPSDPTFGNGTRIITSNPEAVIPWPTDDGTGEPEQQTISVRNRNLGIELVDGNIDVSNTAHLHARLSNLGELNINLSGHSESQWPSQSPPPCNEKEIAVRFFQNASGSPPDFDDPPAASFCVNPDPNNGDVMLPAAIKSIYPDIANGVGYFIAEINPNRGSSPILQCRDNDWSKIFCFSEPRTSFFVLEYWGWLQ